MMFHRLNIFLLWQSKFLLWEAATSKCKSFAPGRVRHRKEHILWHGAKQSTKAKQTTLLLMLMTANAFESGRRERWVDLNLLLQLKRNEGLATNKDGVFIDVWKGFVVQNLLIWFPHVISWSHILTSLAVCRCSFASSFSILNVPWHLWIEHHEATWMNFDPNADSERNKLGLFANSQHTLSSR